MHYQALDLLDVALLLRVGVHAELEAALIDEALRVRLRLEPKQRWDPRTTLFAHAGRRYLGQERDASAGTLLGLWKDVAEARGEGDLVAALTVQLAAQVGADRGARC